MTHGATRYYKVTRLYRIWAGMKTRTQNAKRLCFADYGGRGITICEEWKNSFEAFSKWANENGYADNLTIDRIDNDKGYSPDNCRWATRKQQTQNRRSDNAKEIQCVETKKIYHSAREAANDVGCGRTNIVETLNGRSKTASGYHWIYTKGVNV